MKIIDLLNKIANGKDIPHFRVCEIEYFLNDRRCLREKEEDRPSEDTRWFIDEDWLNKEVEIIEEDKKIKKLKPELLKLREEDEHWEYVDYLRINVHFLAEKVNEIIDYLMENKQ